MKQSINLKKELDANPEIDYEQINRRLLAVAQMQTVCEVLMAEIEDIMTSAGKYKYTIKRNHTRIVEMIKSQYESIYKTFSDASTLDDFVVDNQELQIVIRCWVNLIKKKKVVVCDMTDYNRDFKMTVNPAGDVYLQCPEGWVVSIPKRIVQDNCTEEVYEKLCHCNSRVRYGFYIKPVEDIQ